MREQSRETTRAGALAASAREKLAGALSHLQANATPPALIDATGAVARGLELLRRFEQHGTPEAAEQALKAVRDALRALQGAPPLQVTAAATSLVAESLGLVHTIGELAQNPQESHAKAARSVAQATYFNGSPAVASPDVTDTVKQGRKGGVEERSPAEPRKAAARLPEPPPGTPLEVALGAHGRSNFFRGISSDDVARTGGLFVATYDLLPVGTSLRVRVSLPGGYDFEADAIVRWRRENPPGASMAPEVSPGFGLELRSLSQAARELISRYTQQREPLLHDD